MAREFGRPQRVADHLRKELSQLIQFQMRDLPATLLRVSHQHLAFDSGNGTGEFVKVLESFCAHLQDSFTRFVHERAVEPGRDWRVPNDRTVYPSFTCGEG